MNVTCESAVTQNTYRRNLLEIAPVGSYANVTVQARGADGRVIPSGQVTFRLDDELFYVTSEGRHRFISVCAICLNLVPA